MRVLSYSISSSDSLVLPDIIGVVLHRGEDCVTSILHFTIFTFLSNVTRLCDKIMILAIISVEHIKS